MALARGRMDAEKNLRPPARSAGDARPRTMESCCGAANRASMVAGVEEGIAPEMPIDFVEGIELDR